MHRRSTLQFLAVLVVTCCVAAVANAATWHVAEDGSGDFTVIQAAVDAASDGDTIAIGPGHFSDSSPHGNWEICVLLDGTKSLSFVGAGSGATVVGPESLQIDDHAIGFAYFSASQVYSVSIEGVTIANSYHGLDGGGCRVQVSNCRVEDCYMGLVMGSHVAGEITVTDCTFEGTSIDGVTTGIFSLAPLSTITSNEIRDWGTGIHLANNVGGDALISNCTIDGEQLGRIGISITDGPSATILNCAISNQGVYGVALSDAGAVTFQNNTIEGCDIVGVSLDGCWSLTMNDNVIRTSAMCFYVAYPCDQQTVRNNHFLRYVERDGYYIQTPEYYPWGPIHADFTLNYWGTTNHDEISQWIIDGHDLPYGEFYISFEPVLGMPVRTEQKSWSSVKGLFKAGNE